MALVLENKLEIR